MFFTNYCIAFLIVITSLFSPLTAGEDYTREQQTEALVAAKTIESRGVLRQKKNGFVYLDVDNAFIQKVIPGIALPGKISPIKNGSKGMGAHISVITEQEVKRLGAPQVSEVGKIFSFHVIEVRSFIVQGTKLWALIVEAPELTSLRRIYGLEPELKGHAFHITLGKQAAVHDETGKKPVYEELQDKVVKEADYTIETQKPAFAAAQRIKISGVLTKKDNGLKSM